MITSHEKQELRDTICWSSKPSWTLITLLTGNQRVESSSKITTIPKKKVSTSHTLIYI
ncbi:hypothetical protein HanPI659440_Chr04g0178331 [Helianthus annuus]|nr:hypothetical protein HanPI659440_Chr04g0178331 [Helianthus annuus]